MIVEIRKYRIKPGRRAEFIELFQARTGPAQTSVGMRVLGPFLDLEDPDSFVFLRSFPSLEERERMKVALYEGRLWKNELEGIAMPLIDEYSVVLCEAPSRFFNGPLDFESQA